MSKRRWAIGRGVHLGHGLVDSSLGSLASFIIGLYASGRLPSASLGVYGLAFAGFQLSGTVSADLICRPIELGLVERSPADQLAALRRSVRLALSVAAIAAAIVALAIWILSSDRPGSSRLGLLVGFVLAATISPVQDHMRRMLHQADRSAWAVRLSAVQLAASFGSVLLLDLLGVKSIAVPFLALSIANILSLAVGMLALGAMGATRGQRGWLPPLRSLVRVGRFLLYAGLVMRSVGFLASALIGRRAGWSAAGEVEAVRVLSQPLVVVATGLITVLRPFIVRSLRLGDVARVGRIRRGFVAAVLGSGALLALVIGPVWPLNPFPALFQAAYSRPGLLIAMALATAATNIWPPYEAEFLAVGRQRSFARATFWASLAWLAALGVALRGGAGSFAAPVGMAVFAVVVLALCSSWLVPLRRQAAHQAVASPGDPAKIPSARERDTRSRRGELAGRAAVDRSGVVVSVRGRPLRWQPIRATQATVGDRATQATTRAVWVDAGNGEELASLLAQAVADSPDVVVVLLQERYRAVFLERRRGAGELLGAAGYVVGCPVPSGPRPVGFGTVLVGRKPVAAMVLRPQPLSVFG